MNWPHYRKAGRLTAIILTGRDHPAAAGLSAQPVGRHPASAAPVGGRPVGRNAEMAVSAETRPYSLHRTWPQEAYVRFSAQHPARQGVAGCPASSGPPSGPTGRQINRERQYSIGARSGGGDQDRTTHPYQSALSRARRSNTPRHDRPHPDESGIALGCLSLPDCTSSRSRRLTFVTDSPHGSLGRWPPRRLVTPRQHLGPTLIHRNADFWSATGGPRGGGVVVMKTG